MRPRLLLAGSIPLVLALQAGCKHKEGGDCSGTFTSECADHASELVCVDNKWKSFQCTGANGCKPGRIGDVSYADCDLTVADVGGACTLAIGPSLACGRDGKTLLRCNGRVSSWTQAARCEGPSGCTACPDGVHDRTACCDGVTQARKDDKCAPSLDGQETCDESGDALLRCGVDARGTGWQWVTMRSCGPQKCNRTGPGKASCR